MNAKETAGGQTGFFTGGKVDIGFEIQKDYVAGVCLAYQSRADQEHEYMIREKSFVVIGGRDLSACVEEAKDLAYKAVICRLEIAGNSAPAPMRPAMPTAPALEPVLTEKENAGESEDAEKQQTDQNAPPVGQNPKQPDPPETDGEDDPGDASDFDDGQDDEDSGGDDGEDTGDVSDFEDDDGEDSGDDGDDGEQPQGNGVQRLDLGHGLQPASNLLNNAPPAQKPAQAAGPDDGMKKALAMPITILGKLHASYGKTAGEILATDPQCIVDFAHRYKGPKEDEKDALVKLYPEAVRRVQNAA